MSSESFSDRPDPFSASNKARAKEIEERILNHRIEAFVRDWKPTDPRDVSQFTADLVTIVQTIHYDAVRQWAEYIEVAAAKVAGAPFIIVDKDKASKS